MSFIVLECCIIISVIILNKHTYFLPVGDLIWSQHSISNYSKLRSLHTKNVLGNGDSFETFVTCSALRINVTSTLTPSAIAMWPFTKNDNHVMCYLHTRIRYLFTVNFSRYSQQKCIITQMRCIHIIVMWFMHTDVWGDTLIYAAISCQLVNLIVRNEIIENTVPVLMGNMIKRFRHLSYLIVYLNTKCWLYEMGISILSKDQQTKTNGWYPSELTIATSWSAFPLR